MPKTCLEHRVAIVRIRAKKWHVKTGLIVEYFKSMFGHGVRISDLGWLGLARLDSYLDNVKEKSK